MKGLSALLLLTCLGIPALSAATDRIVDRVDLGRTAPLRGHRHSQAIPRNDRGPADPAAELRYVTLVLQPAAGLEAFLAEQQTPSSPNYRRWLTPEQFADRFGLSANDIGKLTGWLQGAGLTVHDVARGRHWITFSGSVDRVGRALHTEFRRYQVKGAMHIANATEPSVPAAFASVIAGFNGLDDIQPKSMVSQAQPRFDSASGGHYLAPDDFAAVYDVKPLYAAGIDGTGISIAVIGASEIDDTYTPAFRTYFGLPANPVEKKLVGAAPQKNGAEIEAYLDLQWSGAVARGAHIIYVYSSSVMAAAQYAIDQNLAPIVTLSFGGCEQDSIGYRPIAQQANAQGITWVASSGDAGAATCDYMYSPTPQAALGPTAGGPASFPEITAVGGTQFNDAGAISKYWAAQNDANHASALSYIPEIVWNGYSTSTLFDAASGAGSGFYPKPSWQIGTADDSVRDIPDVSLSATRYLVATSATPANGLSVVAGTSASSPAFAGILALLTQSLIQQKVIAQPGLGNVNPTLYRLAKSTTNVFNDIVNGDNNVPCVQSSPQCVNGTMGYAAAPGYDLATGLGTVDANNLVTQWTAGTASRTVLAADATSVGLSDTVHLTATVTGGKTTPTGTVMFNANDSTIATATLTPSADGASATATASVPASSAVFNGMVYGLYSGDSVYDSSYGSVGVKLNPTPGHSQVAAIAAPIVAPLTASGWIVTLGLAEKGGVSTTLTSATYNGSPMPLSYWGGGPLAANSTASVTLVFPRAAGNVLPTTPTNTLFSFKGQDADGTAWSQQFTVTFSAGTNTYILPSMALTTTPTAVQQNPQADPACQWKQDLTIEERAGLLTRLTKLTVGSVDFTGQIQTIFGTTRLAPYGSLRGSMCWSGTNTVPGSNKTFTITGAAATGTGTASATANYQGTPGTTAAFSASPDEVDLTVPDNAHNASATVDLAFTGASPSWQLAVLPANSTTSWLKVSPLSGTGSGPLTVQADTSGLSIGAYQATIAISAPGAVPNYLNIPVVLVVGASSTTITGIGNAASFQPVFAPGMLAAVYGTGLANTTATARTIPLPLKSSGVSATINGISTPIWGTYPQVQPGMDQINLQIPYEAGSGPALLAVNNNGAVAYYRFQIAAAAPGLFGIWDPNGNPLTSVKQGQIVVAYITGDGDQTPTLASGATPAVTTLLSNLPKPRMGLSVTVGGVDVGKLGFYGMPSGFVGVTQINFTVPANAPLGKQDVVVTVGGVASNPATLTVTSQ
jgi:uncharacterized protein (TIGR03437 family)